MMGEKKPCLILLNCVALVAKGDRDSCCRPLWAVVEGRVLGGVDGVQEIQSSRPAGEEVEVVIYVDQRLLRKAQGNQVE